MKKLLFFFLLGICFISSTFSQRIRLEGVVKDISGNTLFGANILATSIKTDQKVFTITDESGRFRIQLKENESYHLEISFMGFVSHREEISFSEDTFKEYMLPESRDSLEEVVVKSKMAVIIKKDTITYNVESFKTGSERKLGDLLKNLPGVEVDQKGRITVNGKRITKLMIDGKDFFGGDTKLGVDNIPADVIESIEALDNYSEVAFMKDLAESDRMALNIKLKKGKKNFLFGESRVGAGIKNRYEVVPALFYYSPKTTVNLLGNFNNTGDTPLDYNAVARFKGGRSNWDDPIESEDTGLYRFSEQPNARFQKTNFGGINFNQEVSPHLFIEAYSIFAHQNTEKYNESEIFYLTAEPFNEDRKQANVSRDLSSFNKIKLRYKPDASKDLAYNALVNYSDNRYSQELFSSTADSTNFIKNNKDQYDLSVQQYFHYYTRPSYEKTFEISANYVYEQETYSTLWEFDKPVFSDVIPFRADGNDYSLNQNFRSFINKGQAELKHYRILNPFHHLYPVAGVHFYHQIFKTEDYQNLNDGNTVSFTDAGFDNDLHFTVIDPYFGLEYKVKLNKVILTSGLFYHRYFWRIHPFESLAENHQKGLLLPQFLGRYDISNRNKLELRYKMVSGFQNASYYADRFRLISFNQLFRGNARLENTLAHNTSLGFSRFNNLKKFNLYAELSWTHRAKTIQNATILEGIDQISTVVYSDRPEESFGLHLQIGKTVRSYKFSFTGRADVSDYFQLINSEEMHYKSQFYTYTLNAETLFKKWPNFGVGLRQNFFISESRDFRTSFFQTEPYASLSWSFWNGFILKADYTCTIHKNQTERQRNVFDDANFSLFYRLQNSPFGFEIKGYNLFDTQSRRINYVNQFLVFDQEIFIQPRRILFSFFYRL